MISFALILIDPYNFFNVSHVYSDEIKFKCLNRTNESIPRGTILWKTIEYRRNPAPNIILGDSRVVDISPKALDKLFNGRSYNLGIAGSSYRSAIELFWMAAKTTKLKNVLFQVNFDTYTVEANTINLYTPTKKLIDQPTSFFFNSTFMKDAIAIVYYSVTKDEKFVNRGFKHGSDGWAKTTRALEKLNVDNYKYPESLKSDLAKIGAYCKENNISLTFFVAPNYYTVNDVFNQLGMAKNYARFMSDMNDIGHVIDLTGIPLSYNKANYNDHFHLKVNIADTIGTILNENIETEGFKFQE
jgi:hypothetical protein